MIVTPELWYKLWWSVVEVLRIIALMWAANLFIVRPLREELIAIRVELTQVRVQSQQEPRDR